jgi:hypothetical protein
LSRVDNYDTAGSLDSSLGTMPFIFAVPLKPKRMSADWDATQVNLRRTLRSIEHATRHYPVQTVVACHDEPDLAELDRSRVTVLRVPYAEPETLAQGTRDKSRKRRHIGAWLRETVAENVYVMFLDADDLVHRDLVGSVYESGSASLLVTDGYVVDVVSGLVWLRRATFYESCGSSFVCRFAPHELPTSLDDMSSPYSQFGSSPDHRGHQDYDEVAADLGRPPVPLGLPGVAYLVNHTESMWRAKGRGLRRFEYPTELVSPRSGRRVLAEDFAAPDLAGALAGPVDAAIAFSRASAARLRSRLARRLAR